MKFFRFATVSTLALTAATMGAADNNEASLLQNGTLNSALVEQNQGVSNTALLDQAGASNDSTITQTGDGNLAGQVRSRKGSVRILNAMQQAGDNNILDIEQTANNGQIGNLDRGVVQSGDRNTATVLQIGNGARLGSIQQIGATGATRSQNNLDVVQGGGNGNFILNISQTKQGARNRANEMTVVQDGRRNLLGQRPAPAGTGLLQEGRANTMTVTQNGNDNGSGGVRGETGAFTGAAALAAMVQQGSASQVGTRNRLEYTATGDNNLFGSIQNGSDNSASIASDGSRNEAASLQLGDGNTVYIFQGTFPIIARFGVPLGFPTASDDNIAGTYVDGDDNLVGTFQLNNANTASSTVIGNQNELLTTQLGDNNNSDSSVAGDRNTVTTSQSGSAGPSNASSVSVDGRRGQGNANTVFIQQAGLNASNIDIFGDRSEVTVNQLGTNTSEVSIRVGAG